MVVVVGVGLEQGQEGKGRLDRLGCDVVLVQRDKANTGSFRALRYGRGSLMVGAAGTPFILHS